MTTHRPGESQRRAQAAAPRRCKMQTPTTRQHRRPLKGRIESRQRVHMLLQTAVAQHYWTYTSPAAYRGSGRESGGGGRVCALLEALEVESWTNFKFFEYVFRRRRQRRRGHAAAAGAAAEEAAAKAPERSSRERQRRQGHAAAAEAATESFFEARRLRRQRRRERQRRQNFPQLQRRRLKRPSGSQGG